MLDGRVAVINIDIDIDNPTLNILGIFSELNIGENKNTPDVLINTIKKTS